MRNKTIALLAAGLFLVLLPFPAFGVSKEIIQLQTEVQALTDQMARMQQSFDERMGVMKSLIEQSTDNMNKISAAVDVLQKGLQQQNSDTASHVDQVSGQIQALHDSLDELKARVAKLSKQIDDMSAAQQNLSNSANPPPSAAAQMRNQAPPPDVLYNNALRDYNAGKSDLALQEFSDYMKFYGTTDLAGNAQFYVADIEYRQGDFEHAVKDYDKVLEQYAGGNKTAAAQLKKGYALFELGQRQAAIRELNTLIARYPRSIEASQARDRLRKEGAAPASYRKPSPSR